MKYNNLFPKISAQIFPSNTSKEEFFLFNPATNRGFSIDGIAAHLCRKFTGERKLQDLITELEKEQNLNAGLFKDEIEKLLADLENNKLITFHESPLEN